MFGESPFFGRVALLLALMVLFAGFDRWRHGAQATRFQEYGFILSGGVLGCLAGACNDWITSGISPEYFTLGKGLAAENIRMEAAMLGLKTGFSAGVIGGAVALFASGGKRGVWRSLYGRLWMPLSAAIAGALVVPLVASRFDPTGLRPQLSDLISAEQSVIFLRVWWIHTGLYAGLAAGLAWMIIDTRKALAQKTQTLG